MRTGYVAKISGTLLKYMGTNSFWSEDVHITPEAASEDLPKLMEKHTNRDLDDCLLGPTGEVVEVHLHLSTEECKFEQEQTERHRELLLAALDELGIRYDDVTPPSRAAGLYSLRRQIRQLKDDLTGEHTADDLPPSILDEGVGTLRGYRR